MGMPEDLHPPDPGTTDEPVSGIPGEPDRAEPGIALCLSGGGYRAMLFHLGALWRLNEAGYLPRLDRVSSVSGGSMTNGALALAWPTLDFDETTGWPATSVRASSTRSGSSPGRRSTCGQSSGASCSPARSAIGTSAC